MRITFFHVSYGLCEGCSIVEYVILKRTKLNLTFLKERRILTNCSIIQDPCRRESHNQRG